MGVGSVVKAEDSLRDAITKNLGATQMAAGLSGTKDPIVVIQLVIKGALGLVAGIFFIMIIIAGFRWMTAGGSEETITNSKKNIQNAVIGLIVIMFAYAITKFVFDVVLSN